MYQKRNHRRQQTSTRQNNSNRPPTHHNGRQKHQKTTNLKYNARPKREKTMKPIQKLLSQVKQQFPISIYDHFLHLHRINIKIYKTKRYIEKLKENRHRNIIPKHIQSKWSKIKNDIQYDEEVRTLVQTLELKLLDSEIEKNEKLVVDSYTTIVSSLAKPLKIQLIKIMPLARPLFFLMKNLNEDSFNEINVQNFDAKWATLDPQTKSMIETSAATFIEFAQNADHLTAKEDLVIRDKLLKKKLKKVTHEELQALQTMEQYIVQELNKHLKNVHAEINALKKQPQRYQQFHKKQQRPNLPKTNSKHTQRPNTNKSQPKNLPKFGHRKTNHSRSTQNQPQNSNTLHKSFLNMRNKILTKFRKNDAFDPQRYHAEGALMSQDLMEDMMESETDPQQASTSSRRPNLTRYPG
jgi:hypothetical protein